MATRLHILDGAKSIGGTKMAIEEDGRGIILDFGLNYSRLGLFFDEFLSPRTGRGILDYILTGLLPRFRDPYREDLFIDHPDLAGLPDLGISLEAVLFSHPHFDHTGLAGFLREDIPFYGSSECALTLKACQDVRSETDRELVYTRPRLSEGYLVKKPRSKAEGEKLARWRPWRIFADELSPEFKEFWDDFCLSKVKCETSEPEPVGTEFQAGPFRVKVWPVDHSAPGAVAFAIETSAGWVIYTGDLRFHGYAGGKTERFMEEASELSPVRALLIEGTRAGEKGSTGEEDVARRALDVVKSASGKAINAEFPLRHPQRLVSFARVARETGRRLVLVPSDFYTASVIAIAEPSLMEAMADVLIYKEEKSRFPGWEKALAEKYPERAVTPVEVAENPGDYILSFRYWSMNKLLDIPGLAGGIHIYSTSEPHSEEQEWDLNRLREWLRLLGITMVGDPTVDSEDPLHASGHASGDELIGIIEALSPREVIPIHTEAWNQEAENFSFFKKNVRSCPVREPELVIEL